MTAFTVTITDEKTGRPFRTYAGVPATAVRALVDLLDRGIGFLAHLAALRRAVEGLAGTDAEARRRMR